MHRPWTAGAALNTPRMSFRSSQANPCRPDDPRVRSDPPQGNQPRPSGGPAAFLCSRTEQPAMRAGQAVSCEIDGSWWSAHAGAAAGCPLRSGHSGSGLP